MKVLFIVLFGLASGIAQATTYKCQSTADRSRGGTNMAKATFAFRLYHDQVTKNGINLRGLQGEVDFNESKAFYAISSLTNNPKYRPTRYKDSIQFQNVNSTSIEGQYAEDVTGTLIIERTPTRAQQVKAHYNYQLEQAGGTIDLLCDEEIN